MKKLLVKIISVIWRVNNYFCDRMEKRRERAILKAGFTLIEVMIAMAIFVLFLGILMSSYTGIVRAQREVNAYRALYSEARKVMETVVTDLRAGYVVRGGRDRCLLDREIEELAVFLPNQRILRIYQSDSDSSSRNSQPSNLKLTEWRVGEGGGDQSVWNFSNEKGLTLSGSGVRVAGATFKSNCAEQELVTVELKFIGEGFEGGEYVLKTAVSSRWYGEKENFEVSPLSALS